NVKVDAGSVLTLDNTKILGGQLTNYGIIHVETVAGATFDDVNVDNTGGTIQVDSDKQAEPSPASLFVKDGTIITDGTLSIGIAGTLEVSTACGATLSGVDVENCGAIQIDTDSLLVLRDTTITHGKLTVSGTLDSDGTSAIDQANISIGNDGLLEVTSGKLSIDGSGAVTSITNHGTLEAKGGELDIAHEAVTNTGTLQAIDDSILKLMSLTVTNED